MNEEYYLELLRILSSVREEMVADILNTDDVEETLNLVAEIKASTRILDRLKTIKNRKDIQETLTLKGDL